jgi:hypothetical protein
MSDHDDTAMNVSDDTEDEQEVDESTSDASDDGEEAGHSEAPKPKPPADKKPDEQSDPFTPPSEAEWRKTQAALKKANEDGKRHRLRNKELEEAARSNETDHEKALREAREQGEAKFRSPLVRIAARAAFAEAGAFAAVEGDDEKREARFKRMLKLLDLDSVSVDDDGEVIGLAAEVNTLRQEYPEFFQSAKPKPKPRPTAADRQPAEEKPRSSAERHAMKVLGRTG